ncbi:MAG: hypothetical protein NT103_09680 [Campylobacterales bacterium]|nr:hypothetical protein [Campylobacterales bacterium]
MIQEIQKQVIRFALDFQIDSINTYSGYKGDLIVKILTRNKNDVLEIRKHALFLEIKEVVIKEKLDTAQYEIYCVIKDDSIYHLR